MSQHNFVYANTILNLNRILASTSVEMSLPFYLWCLNQTYIIVETGLKKDKLDHI